MMAGGSAGCNKYCERFAVSGSKSRSCRAQGLQHLGEASETIFGLVKVKPFLPCAASDSHA